MVDARADSGPSDGDEFWESVMSEATTTSRARDIAASVDKFVRGVIVPYERDPRWTSHGPNAEMVD